MLKEKNVAFFVSFVNLCSPDIYTHLVKKCRDSGKKILIYHCSGFLGNACRIIQQAPFFSGKYTSCEECIRSVRKIFHDFGGVPLENFFVYEPKEYPYQLPPNCSYLEFKDFSFNNFDYAHAIIGTIATGMGRYYLEPFKYAELYESLVSIAIALYQECILFYNQKEIDEVYIFNGRLISLRAALRAAQKINLKCYTFEFCGNDHTKFMFTEGNYIQDLKTYNQKIIEILKNTTSFEEGKHFFEGRNLVKNNKFVKNFTEGMLPLNFNKQKNNVVIFITTLYECISFKEYYHSLIPLQNSTILIGAIASYLKKYKDIHFYIRIHPNMGNRICDQIEHFRILNSLGLPNLTIIWPEENIDSYHLMKFCNKVITFGSTTGIEATYYHIPSILCGYRRIDWADYAYIPQNFDELISLICNKQLEPKKYLEALRFGYVMQKIPYDLNVEKNNSSNNWLKAKIINFISKIVSKCYDREIEILKAKIANLNKQLIEYKLLLYKEDVPQYKKDTMKNEIANFIKNKGGYNDKKN